MGGWDIDNPFRIPCYNIVIFSVTQFRNKNSSALRCQNDVIIKIKINKNREFKIFTTKIIRYNPHSLHRLPSLIKQLKIFKNVTIF